MGFSQTIGVNAHGLYWKHSKIHATWARCLAWFSNMGNNWNKEMITVCTTLLYQAVCLLLHNVFNTQIWYMIALWGFPEEVRGMSRGKLRYWVAPKPGKGVLKWQRRQWKNGFMVQAGRQHFAYVIHKYSARRTQQYKAGLIRNSLPLT